LYHLACGQQRLGTEKYFMAVEPRLASAVMLLRDTAGQGIEVFMVRRVIQSDFMPDVYVFPGGSVSKDDHAAELKDGLCEPVALSRGDAEGRTALGSGARTAAIRELFEEAGILLAYHAEKLLAITEQEVERFGTYRTAFNDRKGSLVEMAQAEHLTLATNLLDYFAHWITPEGMPKRFDTHFFLTTAPEEQHAAHDRLETSEGIWISPTEALARFERKEFPLVFATIYQLRELAVFSSVKEALNSTKKQHVATRIPIMVQEDGKTRVFLQEDADTTWEVPEHMTRT
jgi:8-oxo-dGTP pyrophosphatase MutT (NUDIX family)